MAGPKGMPQPIVRKLNQIVRSALDSPDVQEALRSAAAEPAGSSPEQMLQFMQKEASRWSAVIR
jgi:tripartite-type tricarboxylate transporter receptor subunit TctC